MRQNKGLFALGVVFLLASSAFAGDYILDKDPNQLESSAKYNYFIGKYYFNQGKYGYAEQYFTRSRDMMQRRSDMLGDSADLGANPAPVVAGGRMSGGEYLVSDGDVLFVSVWQNDDLNEEVIVRPDGKISFPLVGDLQAVGRSLTQIDSELTKRLKEFVKYPEVSVSIRRFGGSKVIILGEVNRPGVYAVSGNRTILEAIALAGGMTYDAVANSVVLVRGGLKNPRAQRLNLRRAMIGKPLKDDVVIQSEDIIYVPKTFVANVAYLMNQIVDPVSRGAMTAQGFQTVLGQTPSTTQ